MKKVNKLSIFTYLFLLFIIFIKLFSILGIVKLSNCFIPILLVIYFIFSKFITRKEYIRKNETANDVKGIIIYLVVSLLLYFLLGIIFGFSYNVYSYSFKDIVINLFVLIIPTLIYEYIRYYLIKHSSDKKILYIAITLLIILVDFNTNNLVFDNSKLLYIRLFSEIIPSVIKNIILTIIMVKYGLSSCLAYQIIYTIFIIYCHYLPNVGYFLNFLILSLIPIVVYSRLKGEDDRKEIYKGKNYVEIFTFIISFILLLFSFGIFKISPMSVASNSMKPMFERGDLVVYYKVDDKYKLKKEDIIVFNYSGNIYIHRIKKIIKRNDKLYYKTKGDANSNYDGNLTSLDDVIGIYKFKIKYIGYPALWMGELLK